MKYRSSRYDFRMRKNSEERNVLSLQENNRWSKKEIQKGSRAKLSPIKESCNGVYISLSVLNRRMVAMEAKWTMMTLNFLCLKRRYFNSKKLKMKISLNWRGFIFFKSNIYYSITLLLKIDLSFPVNRSYLVSFWNVQYDLHF